MAETRTQSGADFYKRLMAYLGLTAVVSVALIALYFYALLRLSEAEWRAFLSILAVLAPVMFVGTSLLNRPLYRPITRHLDAADEGEATPESLRDAFRAVCDLPYKFFLSGLFWWTTAGLFVAGVMAWQFETFGAFRATALILASASGGFVCSVFVFAGLKRFLAELRSQLAGEIPDPSERQTLVRRIDLGRKLRWSVTGVTSVTVGFALFLSLVHVSGPLESNAVEIQSRFLAARAELLEGDVASFQSARDEARELGIASELLLVDLESREVIDGDSELLIDAELQALSAEYGRSTVLDSPHAFAWMPIEQGELAVVAVQPWERLRPDAMSSWLRFGLTLLFSAAIALALSRELASEIGESTQQLCTHAERVAAGDLRRGAVLESEDELGDLFRAFERMRSALRATVGRVSETADRVEGSASETMIVSESVAGAAESQAQGVVETARAMGSLTTQVSEISASAQELNLLVEDASSSIMEMGASGEQLAETATSLFGKVDEASSAIQEGAASMREVSSNAAALAEVAENTSASSVEMAKNMSEVATSAEDSAERSRQVVQTAERGQETVRHTVESMELIRRATDSAQQVIRGLGERATEIGSIVDVIGDVADETNLLALNAAIIAAQAGEDGRAFSVVAEEIKELADRVLSSTKEIGDLIRSVQAETGNAVQAMADGAGSVAEGVRLSNQAGESLEEITEASRQSGERIEEILHAVREQARASSYVVEQMESVKGGVGAIQRATAEQDRGNESIVYSTEAMREIAQQLQATTSEQARGSHRIRESIEGVRAAIEAINAALQGQGQSSRQVGSFLDELASKGESNEESARRMQEVTQTLLEQAEALRGNVERFQV